MDVNDLAELLSNEEHTDIKEFVELFGKSKEEIEEKVAKVDKMYKETLEKELKNIQEKAKAGDLNAKMTLKFQTVYHKIIVFMDKTVEKGNIQHVIDTFDVIEEIIDNELERE